MYIALAIKRKINCDNITIRAYLAEKPPVLIIREKHLVSVEQGYSLVAKRGKTRKTPKKNPTLPILTETELLRIEMQDKLIIKVIQKEKVASLSMLLLTIKQCDLRARTYLQSLITKGTLIS